MSPKPANSAVPKPRCRAGRRADADPAGLHWRQRIEGDPILVAGDPGAFERFIGVLAGDPDRTQVDQCEVRVGAPGNQVRAAFLHRPASVWAFLITPWHSS
jgi:hypothetical protein